MVLYVFYVNDLNNFKECHCEKQMTFLKQFSGFLFCKADSYFVVSTDGCVLSLLLKAELKRVANLSMNKLATEFYGIDFCQYLKACVGSRSRPAEILANLFYWHKVYIIFNKTFITF